MNTISTPSRIWIVEDDIALAHSLQMLLDSAGLAETLHFENANACLTALPKAHHLVHAPGCLLLDIRLGAMSGIELFTKLKEFSWPWPVIFMTGHGDLEMAVDLVKQGAFDFVTKPFDPMSLINKVQQALQVSGDKIQIAQEQQLHLQRLLSLTKHEQQVLLSILSHKTNREIAEEMSNSTRTIETHRANILKKMETVSALELAQLHERFLLRGGTLPFPTA